MTELTILMAGINSHPIVVIVVMAALVLVFIGFLRHATNMVFGDKPEAVEAVEVGNWNLVPLIILVVILIFLSFYLPNAVKTLINNATLIY